MTIRQECTMLGNHDSAANVAVRDIAVARNFYEDTLGLAVIGTEGEEVVSYRSGHSTILVYRSEYAGTNQATALTWMVGDKVDELARALKAKGVRFEHYEMPQTHLEGDVHVAGERRIAWFRDPDGNILSFVSG
jgi:catechol 2,3-dioxygenase-like lactoylglutathione lyase family enzyme